MEPSLCLNSPTPNGDNQGSTSHAIRAETTRMANPARSEVMPIIKVRIAAGSDDVEQRSSGTMSMDSSDLGLFVDGRRVQAAGIRFFEADIPKGAVVARGYKFQTDEVTTSAASHVIRVEGEFRTGSSTDVEAIAYGRSTVRERRRWPSLHRERLLLRSQGVHRLRNAGANNFSALRHQ